MTLQQQDPILEPADDPEIAAEVIDDAAASKNRRWARLRSDWGFWTGAVIVGFFVFIAIWPNPIASIFGNGDPNACTLGLSRKSATSGHPLGFDVQGCDLYAHVVYGARDSIAIGIFAAGGAAVFGTLCGLVAGYFGRWVDVLISRIAEIVLAVPVVLGAIVILNSTGSHTLPLIIGTLIVLTWIPVMRVVRASTLAARDRSYVLAARAMGLRTSRILFRQILPNVIGPALVLFTTSIAVIISAEASLTYLGVGLQLPAISWGLQLSSAKAYFAVAPHLLVAPIVALALAVAGFVLLGDAVRRGIGVQREAI